MSKNRTVTAIATTVLAMAGLVGASLAQEQPAPAQPPARKAYASGFPDLVAGLKATPGCLGVETARTSGGKTVIFAWFENKKAVLAWYYSDIHQTVMKMAIGDHKPGEPMTGVPDDSGPIMAIASATLSDKPQFEGMSLPVSQISIELYQPITGGIFLGGRFAPEGLKVKNMRDYTPRKQ